MGGATRIAVVISPEKTDMMQYYGERFLDVPLCYIVQSSPRGLCDALFQPLAVIGSDEDVLFGLPDTIWFPQQALGVLPPGESSLLLFPVRQPRYFDAVLTDAADNVEEVEVKVAAPRTSWIWGAGRIAGEHYRALHDLWRERRCEDEYLGTLLNAYIRSGGRVRAVRAGETYLDVGTFDGFRAAAVTLAELETRAS